ncbi:jg10526 [Pararge aegeria aegeria]|uniref:Jg10526 protein n=1 Tax=Pararge aegeria aegeria TaxID=348720 RepID=A0A8S4S6T5_9NEOP|nr:jg10526 [Pararge aegeria aegeria]
MNKVYITVAVLLAVAVIAVRSNTTPAEQCPGQNFGGLSDRIQVLPCESKRCKLRKNSNTTVILKFQTSATMKQTVQNYIPRLYPLTRDIINVSTC